ncbi:GNAT family N-acetyltransferase [Ramlibacter tataouinensis]|uniref:Spermidine N(1)-acetyltransferase (Diamine acetyltransferase)-like protein n=1 Tax=Ramlibacter tataouinensis (strain ATCC BAA-407 / DSM 14655 / LMG 21543 / TTB310) TaxID=365046 RepID=F5Y2W6_RAMTT|nr:GNAT family protein [Ramlibacter tataouinensis]AEG93662.1 spermidine N(1)-acetyltransferase (Diamine acetyltransferase)-like protein [Ramlibacter tataouinensis TTB310]
MTPADPASVPRDAVPARVRLRPTMQSDLEYVVSLEQDPANLPYITPWERTQHEAAIRFPDFRHFIIESGDALASAGFLILIGCKSPHQSLELKRMVVQAQGGGVGRAALRYAKKVAFDDLGAHRFWLDVKVRNTRAKALYDSEGFVVEGTLRESVRTQDGFTSLIVMSMLQPEFLARRAQALELPA